MKIQFSGEIVSSLKNSAQLQVYVSNCSC